jgi:hypothetical protein
MATIAGSISFIYYSFEYGQSMVAYMGNSIEEKIEIAKDLTSYNKYKKNLKLYSDIEAFENWQDSESFKKE